MSGWFADAVRRRQIAGRRQGEQLATREWRVFALHSRLLGGEPHPRWSVETAACQASLSVLAYNLTRVMNIVGTKSLMAAIVA